VTNPFQGAGQVPEAYAMGFRNPYDLAFNPEGELFTFDSDMEWDVGLPWYRPTRVNHLVAGAEFGWRSGWSTWL
jgi:glucose/arabinose dehydrogenase